MDQGKKIRTLPFLSLLPLDSFLVNSIRRHIAAAREARAALAKPSDQEALDENIARLTKQAHDFGSGRFRCSSTSSASSNRTQTVPTQCRSQISPACCVSWSASWLLRRSVDRTSPTFGFVVRSSLPPPLVSIHLPADPLLNSPMVTKGRLDDAAKKVKSDANAVDLAFLDSVPLCDRPASLTVRNMRSPCHFLRLSRVIWRNSER